MNQKRVLLLNACHNDERLLFALKRLGCYVITTGNRPDLPGHKYADEYEYGDYSNLEQMLDLAKKKKVDAVCPCGNDFGVKTAAYISEKLGFIGQDNYETTLILHDKDKFKAFVSNLSGIRTPHSIPFDSEEQALIWAKSNDEYPVIAKSVDLSAGNGIRKANSYKELVENIHNAFQTSRAKRILIEPFIEGTLHGFCTFLVNQRVAAYCSDSEYCIVNPYRVELVSVPCEYETLVKDDLITQIEVMAKALKLTDGIFHLQFILKDGKPYIIECMRRVLGNMHSIAANNHNEGFDWDYWEARAKCGFGCEGFPKYIGHYGVWGHKALVALKNGIYDSVTIPEKIKEHIYYLYMLHEPGYEIDNHGSDPVGLMFCKFANFSEFKEMMITEYDQYSVNIK